MLVMPNWKIKGKKSPGDMFIINLARIDLSEKKGMSQAASQYVAKFYASGCDENEAYQALLAQHSPVAIHAA
jgi:hypothetical protein